MMGMRSTPAATSASYLPPLPFLTLATTVPSGVWTTTCESGRGSGGGVQKDSQQDGREEERGDKGGMRGVGGWGGG